MDQIERAASISGDGMYRWTLERRWGEPTPFVMWIMLNPSTADADKDDPTIRRCMSYSKAWGYGAMGVVNLFAFRATSPADMKAAADPVGPDNNATILVNAIRASKVIAAWGSHGTFRGRSGEVRQLLMSRGVPLYCLERSKDGQPKHPLYLKGDLQPVRMD